MDEFASNIERFVEELHHRVAPPSNSLPIRRLRLEIGQSRELVAAWLRFPDLRVAPVIQRYTRTGENTYIYESVASGYRELIVDEDGIVQTYDGEWVAEGVWNTHLSD